MTNYALEGQSDRVFTLEQLHEDRALIASAAKEEGGCIVVDRNGRKVLGICIPQTDLSDED